ncbi:MAG: hypothetical protein LBT16_00595 [Treponema sp.]|jgi:hypothetical protein|nr:hypothetical protein [Treponema sp.]
MKHFFAILISLILITGFAFAEPIGLELGLQFKPGDFGASDYKMAGDGGSGSIIAPTVDYMKIFGPFGVYLGSSFDTSLNTAEPQGPGPRPEYKLRLEGIAFYNLAIGSASELSFSFGDLFFYHFDKNSSDFNAYENKINPGIRFSQRLGFGNLFVQVEMPMTKWETLDDWIIEAEPKIGIDRFYGFGASFKPVIHFAPDNGTESYAKTVLNVNYTNGPFFGELEVEIPNPADAGPTGTKVTPKFQYRLKTWTFWVKVEIENIANDNVDASIKPNISVSYMF